MPDTQFLDLVSFADAEVSVLAHYKKWINTWLAARERSLDMGYQQIARPRSYISKSSFTSLPGEEATPMIIAVSDGFRVAPARRGDGTYLAWLRFGIAAVVMASEAKYARALAGHYQTALVGIAVRNRSIDDGRIVMDTFENLRIEDIDEEAAGRSMMAVRLELTYRVESFAQEYPRLDLVPDDPSQPVPDEPEVQKVIIGTEVQ